MQETPSGLQLLEPPSPETLLPSHSLAWWWAAAALALAALTIITWLIRRKRRQPSDPTTLRNAAFEEAATALAQSSTSDPRDAAILASLILRRYLATAAADPALFETQEEFIARHNALAALTPESRSATTEAFSRLAALKYGPQPPHTSPADILTEARHLLESLHQGLQP